MQAKNCTLNDWESRFFSKKIYLLDIKDESSGNSLPVDADLITAKVKSTESEKMRLLNDIGFEYVEGEVLMTLALQNSPLKTKSINASSATTDCVDDLVSLFSTQYENSRFKSPWFSEKERDDFYSAWMKNATLGTFDDICLYLKVDENISGFITLKKIDNVIKIGLLGVRSEYKGKGVGSQLLELAVNYAINHQCSKVTVSTQLSNIPAIRLYSKNSFKVEDINYWYYKANK